MIDDEEIIKILKESRTIAVVGCSRDPEKDAHKVPKYLKEHGYRIIPVNPFANEILGEKVYKTLSEIIRHLWCRSYDFALQNHIKEPVDVVDIFRPSDEVLGVVKEAIKLKPKVIWMQLGIRNEEAAKLAEQNGIKVVMNRCMMIEHKRLITQ